jgi:hypothetical protein
MKNAYVERDHGSYWHAGEIENYFRVDVYMKVKILIVVSWVMALYDL